MFAFSVLYQVVLAARRRRKQTTKQRDALPVFSGMSVSHLLVIIRKGVSDYFNRVLEHQ